MKELEVDKSDSVGMLRLNIVEISPEQEPSILEEEEEKLVESEWLKGDESESHSPSEFVSEVPVAEAKDDKIEKYAPKEKACTIEDTESKEVEMDDWLFEFAQLFCSHVCIDPDAHIDLHELGMMFCSEAFEEIVTGEEAQDLFHFLRDQVSKGSLRLEHCSSTNQITDILTKLLKKARFEELRDVC